MMFIIWDVTVSSVSRYHGDKSTEGRHGHVSILNDRCSQAKSVVLFSHETVLNQPVPIMLCSNHLYRTYHIRTDHKPISRHYRCYAVWGNPAVKTIKRQPNTVAFKAQSWFNKRQLHILHTDRVILYKRRSDSGPFSAQVNIFSVVQQWQRTACPLLPGCVSL